MGNYFVTSMLTEEILDPAIIVQHERAKDMLDYLHTHYQEKISLESLAAHVFLSRAECSRFFKKMIGMTPFTYLLHYRLRKSMELLRDSEQSITTIATTSGFSTVSYYIEKLKKYTGYSHMFIVNSFLIKDRIEVEQNRTFAIAMNRLILAIIGIDRAVYRWAY
ncbi:AraC family transcriptional regulator [Lysinibacillus sp. M3]|uniref:AraC family transcriptional regulator n=1 Tax=Lysinibacillus zambalensis TaxID=3160866 RepID=A0ABV1MU64_9BACI